MAEHRCCGVKMTLIEKDEIGEKQGTKPLAKLGLTIYYDLRRCNGCGFERRLPRYQIVKQKL